MAKLKKLLLTLCVVSYAGVAFAVTPFVITDIRVEGVERLEAGTVFNYLPLKVGDELDDEEALLSIRALFDTGFFKDVSLEQDGSVLIVKVVERPSIASIEVEGNKILNDQNFERVLEQASLVQGRIFNSASLERIKQEVRNTYLSLGRYSASVEEEVKELERNRVEVTLKIDEGQVATIKKINIIGAKEVPVKTLIKEMSLRDKEGFSPFSSPTQYSKQKLEADIETIRSYYLDRGFYEFRVIGRSVDISPNKQNIFVSISISEGGQYSFGESEFDITRETPLNENLQALLSITPGQIFSRKSISASRTALVERFSNAGYAFVEVRPVYEPDPNTKTVKTVFAIDPKQRVYVRKVEIIGNIQTRDQIIRREIRQFEGAWYSSGAVALSRSRLRRLGFFQSVTIDTPPVPGTDDQIDVVVTVSERNTGSISFSIGYSDADGTLFGTSFSQRNLLGTGRELSFSINTSDANRTAEINYLNPYHTPDGVSREVGFSRREVDTDEVNTANFVINSIGAHANYKIPIAETNSLNLGFNLERVTLTSSGSTPREFREVISPSCNPMLGETVASPTCSATAESEGRNLLVNLGISKDTRNDFFFPTAGTSRSLSLEVSAPGSDYEYYKLNLQAASYFPLPGDFASKLSLRIGYGSGYGNNGNSQQEGVPFFRRYYAGGPNSVRGYDSRSLGPLSSGATTTPITEPTGNTGGRNTVGGEKRLLLNAEFLFPPFGSDAGKDKQFVLFVDGGMVFGEGFERTPAAPTAYRRITDTGIKLSKLRYTAGIAFNWFSPIGPFSMSYALPLNEEIGDDTEKFQLTVGTVF